MSDDYTGIREALAGDRVAELEAKAQVCLDLHDSLGVRWGDDPYHRIGRLKESEAECAALRAEVAALKAADAAEAARLAECVSWLEGLLARATCAFCAPHLTEAQRAEWEAHALSCQKHPMSKVVAEVAALKGELEQERTRLAGCAVAAQGGATGDNDAKQGDYGWSPAFDDVKRLRSEVERYRAAGATVIPVARSVWHEDIGNVLWWCFPIEEPPYCGTPLDDDFPDYVTHWTRLILPLEPGAALDTQTGETRSQEAP